jgi:hypothetical protein
LSISYYIRLSFFRGRIIASFPSLMRDAFFAPAVETISRPLSAVFGPRVSKSTFGGTGVSDCMVPGKTAWSPGTIFRSSRLRAIQSACHPSPLLWDWGHDPSVGLGCVEGAREGPLVCVQESPSWPVWSGGHPGMGVVRWRRSIQCVSPRCNFLFPVPSPQRASGARQSAEVTEQPCRARGPSQEGT